jgi:hypothetical protein
VTEETEAKKEDEKFAKFVQESVRGPKQGIFEHLLCQNLVSAVGSKPLAKIRLTCEAALMVQDLKSIDIDKDEVDLILKITSGFTNTAHYQSQGAFICFMAFPFESTKENYSKYIEIWCNSPRLSYFASLHFNLWPRDYARECEYVNEEIRKLEAWEFFFHVTKHQNLTEACFNNLLSQFTMWALPKTQIMFSKLAKLVNPRLYEEILKTYSQTQKEPKAESARGPEL